MQYHITQVVFLVLIFSFLRRSNMERNYHKLTTKMNTSFPSLYEHQLLAQQRTLVAGGYHNVIFFPHMQMIQQPQLGIACCASPAYPASLLETQIMLLQRQRIMQQPSSKALFQQMIMQQMQQQQQRQQQHVIPSNHIPSALMTMASVPFANRTPVSTTSCSQENKKLPVISPTELGVLAIKEEDSMLDPSDSSNAVVSNKARSITKQRQGNKSRENKPSARNAKWMESYNELKKYKHEYGSCIVPRGYVFNPRLAVWVAEQRKQYKLRFDGRNSSITAERIALLEQVDFAWNAQEAAWERHMADLKAFKDENGDCLVPVNHPNYPKLGLWVKEQRRHFNFLKRGKPSHMTDSRYVELSGLGFCWDTQEAVWGERLRELKQFKVVNGHSMVPTHYSTNPRLGTWVHHQRRQYREYKRGKPCHITHERIAALDRNGFIWHPRDKVSKGSTERSDDINIEDEDEEEEEEEEEECDEDETTEFDLRPKKRVRYGNGGYCGRK